MDALRCPKCASVHAPGAWICERCEWILDPSVLLSPVGEERRASRPGVGAAPDEQDEEDYATSPLVAAPDLAAMLHGAGPATADLPAIDIDVDGLLGGDAVILGQLADDDAESFLSDRTGSFLVAGASSPSAEAAPVYLSGDLARRLQPAAIPRPTVDGPARRGWLGTFEVPVFDLIDGARTIAELRVACGLSENDLRVALAMLVEKAMIEVPLPVEARPAPAAPAEPALPDDGTSPWSPSGDFDEHTRELDNLPPLSDAGAAPEFEEAVAPLPGSGTNLPAVPEVFDELVMVPLPVPAPMSPPSAPPEQALPTWAPSAPPSPALAEADSFQVPRSDEVELARPAMRVEPLRSRNTPMPPSSRRATASAGAPNAAGASDEPRLAYKPKAGLTRARASSSSAASSPAAPSAAAPSSAAVAKPSAASQEARLRAAQFYEMCMKDLREGRAGRAWGYAKMAADADPSDEKYRQLLAEWGKMVGGASPKALGFSAAPESPKELLEASLAAEQAGDYDSAVAHARKLCEVASTSGAAFNRLSVLLATRVKDYKAAYNAATTAVELDGANMTFQSNMMKILAKLESGDDKPRDAGRGGLMGKLLGK